MKSNTSDLTMKDLNRDKTLEFFDENGNNVDKYGIYILEWHIKNHYKWRTNMVLDFLRHITVINMIGNGIAIFHDFSELKSHSLFKRGKIIIENSLIKQMENAKDFLCVYNYFTEKFVICDLEKENDKKISKKILKTILPGYTMLETQN